MAPLKWKRPGGKDLVEKTWWKRPGGKAVKYSTHLRV